jgi:hypothetical protein
MDGNVSAHFVLGATKKKKLAGRHTDPTWASSRGSIDGFVLPIVGQIVGGFQS